MKFFLALVSAIACFLTLLKAHPQPGNRLADLSEALEGQADDMPPEIESPEFFHLMFKCCHQEDWALGESCEKETELKLNTTKLVPKIGASKADRENFKKKTEKFAKLTYECYLKKTGGVDEITNQFKLVDYTKDYNTTSLSLEQRTLASADFQSCLTANFITPSLPIFIRWIESSTKENGVVGNMVTATRVMLCDGLALSKNGCSDTSVSSAALAWIIKEIEADIAKDLFP